MSNGELPLGMSREDAIKGLRHTVRMAEEAQRLVDPDFVRWPDLDTMIDHIEAHGFPPPAAAVAVAVQPESTDKHASVNLKGRGWSLRRAAAALGVSHVHLSLVLSGKRQSQRLMDAAAALGRSPVPYRQSGFARRAS